MAKQRRGRRKPQTNVDDLKVRSYDKQSVKDLPKNDPEWYIYDKDMFEGVISMPTIEFKGRTIDWRHEGIISGSTNPLVTKMKGLFDSKMRTPTVAGYLMNPGLETDTIQNLTPANSYTAINVAARKMYAELSASNAKTSQYAPQDIATLILSLGQVIACITHLKRMYGVANYYNFYSRRVPSDIFQAMGVNGFTELSNGLASFRNKVNQLIARIDTIQFPTGLSYFKKCEYIYQNVFVDRDEKMITYHVMAPASTWELDEESYDQGTILRTVQMANRRFSEQLTVVEGMIEKILTSSTFNTIFADIINLSNRNVLSVDNLQISTIPIEFVAEPIYSEQFNWQIMNMSILPKPNGSTLTAWDTPWNDVYPSVNTNELLYSPVFNAPNGDSGLLEVSKFIKHIPIRLPDTNPSQDMFVELLAYYAIVHPISEIVSGTQKSSVKYASVPDYWCSKANIVRPNTEGPDSLTNGIESNCMNKASWYNVGYTAQFVHFPFIAMVDMDTNTQTTDIMPVSRLSAYTQINLNALLNLRYETYLGLLSFKR